MRKRIVARELWRRFGLMAALLLGAGLVVMMTRPRAQAADATPAITPTPAFTPAQLAQLSVETFQPCDELRIVFFVVAFLPQENRALGLCCMACPFAGINSFEPDMEQLVKNRVGDILGLLRYQLRAKFDRALFQPASSGIVSPC